MTNWVDTHHCVVTNCQEQAWACCLYCDISYCYSHREHLIKYPYSIYCSALWNDGRYCQKCDERLRFTKEDPLHCAYMEIEHLRKELLWSRLLPHYLQTQEKRATIEQRYRVALELTERNNKLVLLSHEQ